MPLSTSVSVSRHNLPCDNRIILIAPHHLPSAWHIKTTRVKYWRMRNDVNTCTNPPLHWRVEKISKLLNAFSDKNKRPHNEKSLRVWDIVELQGENEGKDRRWREDVTRFEKSWYTFRAHRYCRMYIYRRVHFRASDPRIGERRLFASRHLVAKPAVLFTYLLLPRTHVLRIPCWSSEPCDDR